VLQGAWGGQRIEQRLYCTNHIVKALGIARLLAQQNLICM
jgi:hypothetical protein